MPNHRITHNLEQGGWEDKFKPNHFFLNGNFVMVPGVRNFISLSTHTLRDQVWHLASRLGEYTPNNQ